MSDPTVSPERRALAERAIQLRIQGMTARQIGAELGVSRGYANALYCDPWKLKEHARRESYRKPCPGCGALMDPSNGRQAPSHCKKCAPAAAVVWTKEAIVAAFQEFHAKTGRSPGAVDASPALLRGHNFSDTRRVEATTHGVDLPVPETVRERFGSWEAGMRAAGLEPTPTGGASRRELGPLQKRILRTLERNGGAMRFSDLAEAVLGKRKRGWGMTASLDGLIEMGLVERERVSHMLVFYHLVPS